MNRNTQSFSVISDAREYCDPATILIRIPAVETITGSKRATIYKRLKDDPTFPKPVQLSNSKARGAPVAWVLAEVQEWVRQRIALREVAA